MNKKFIQAVISLAVFTAAVFSVPFTYATGDSAAGNGYNERVVIDDLNFSAVLSGGSVQTSWSEYMPDGFNYYKVVRSTTNSDPVYPDDGYIFYGTAGQLSYTDSNPPTGTSYYRVCSIASPNRYCSPVITITNTASDDTSAETDTDSDTPAKDSNGYYPKTVRSEFNFTATLTNEGKVVMTWAPYAPSGFNYYKVIRSATNSDPVYPDDGYIQADGNASASAYTDSAPPAGTSYYRVCSITKPYRYCSEVVKIYNTAAVTPQETTTADKPKPTLYSSIAPADGITLKAEAGSDGVYLAWSVDGTTPKGTKIAISTVNENPTYPVMSGDDYRYLSDPHVRSYTDVRVTAGKTYYYRVCQYDGAGKCLVYSNPVSVTIPDDYVKTYKTTDKAEITAVKESVKEKEEAKALAIKEGRFYDAEQHLYKTAINYLKAKEVVEGYDDGAFRPDNSINRAEFMKIVIAAKYSHDYISVSAGWNCFTDVGTEWFAPYICIAKKEGIVSGYEDGSFKPAQNISFVEAAKILAEVYGLDFAAGETWYEGYVEALQENNYIPSTIDALAKNITRAEMAELIWRIREQKKDQSYSTLLLSN